MEYPAIDKLVKEIIAKQLNMDAANIKSEALLVQDLGLDSFGSVETAFELEERFGVKIPDEAVYNAKTVKDIVDFLAGQKLNPKTV